MSIGRLDGLFALRFLYLIMGGRMSIGRLDGLFAHLLGQGQLNTLTLRSTNTCGTLFSIYRSSLYVRNIETFLGGHLTTLNLGQFNGLVDAMLLGLRVGDINTGLNRCQNRCVVTGFLVHLSAVGVVSISTIAGRFAHRYSIFLAFLVERNFDSFGCGFYSFWTVGVGTDLIVNSNRGLSTHCPGDGLALLSLHNVQL